MSKGLTTNQKTEIAKQEIKTRTLLTIYINNNDEDVIRILSNDTLALLSLNGNDYVGAMMKRGDINSETNLGRESVKITISDINQNIVALLGNDGDVLTNSRCILEEIIFNGFPADWQSETAYTDEFVSPVTKNSYIYECTTAGTTGISQPTWPTTIGNTVNDGTVVWTCRSPIIDDPIYLFDGYANGVSVTYAGVLSFDIERILGGYSTQSPNSTYDVNCYYRFKDARCQYSGVETTCDKTFTSCLARSNTVRFGGYPSIPQETVIKNA